MYTIMFLLRRIFIGHTIILLNLKNNQVYNFSQIDTFLNIKNYTPCRNS